MGRVARMQVESGPARRFPGSNRAGTLAFPVTAVTAVALGFLVSISSDNVIPLVVALGLAALPAVALLAAEHPAWALGIFLALQPLEAFELQTPVGTLSPGALLLLVLLLFQAPRLLEQWRTSRAVRVIVLLMAFWAFMSVTRFSYAPPNEVVREMIRGGSFAAIVLLGITVAREWGILRAAAVGAAAALLVLAVCGVLVGTGILPPPTRFQPSADPRALLGIPSPITRSFGLNVDWDAIALLVPLCVPYFTLMAFSAQGLRRAGAVALVTSLTVAIVFVFQSRGMLVQVLVIVLVAFWFHRPRLGVIVVAALLPLVVLFLGSLRAVDEISSTGRTANFQFVAHDLVNNPGRYVLGSNEADIYFESLRSLPATDVFAANRNLKDVHLHNLFLSNLAAGGVIAFVLLLWVYTRTTKHALHVYRAKPAASEGRVLLLAVIATLSALATEPVTSNIVGSWLVVGLVIGIPAQASPSTESASSRPAEPKGQVNRLETEAVSSATAEKGIGRSS